MLRCPSIYIATFMFSILMLVILTGSYIGLGFIWLNGLIAAPFFSDIFAAIRFIFGYTWTFILTLFMVFGFLTVLLKAGQAGMFLKLHQGGRPGVADFSAGIGRYTWRYLKGYFHFAVLMTIPMLINYGLIILRFGSYSTNIFTHGLNRGLKVEFLKSVHTGEWVVFIIQAVIFLLLFVWDESVVLEGSTFQKSFIRSFRFVTKHPVKVLIIGVVNRMIIFGLFYSFFIAASSLFQGELMPMDPAWSAGFTNSLIVREFWFALVMLLVLPILAYTHYLLYLPSRPFGSMVTRQRFRPKEARGTLILEDNSTPPGISVDGSERDDTFIRLDE